MKIGVRRGLVGAGIIWLIIVLCIVFFGFCNMYCLPGAKCGCQVSDLFCFVLVLGIPSWIFFLISLGIEDEGREERSSRDRFKKNL